MNSRSACPPLANFPSSHADQSLRQLELAVYFATSSNPLEHCLPGPQSAFGPLTSLTVLLALRVWGAALRGDAPTEQGRWEARGGAQRRSQGQEGWSWLLHLIFEASQAPSASVWPAEAHWPISLSPPEYSAVPGGVGVGVEQTEPDSCLSHSKCQ